MKKVFTVALIVLIVTGILLGNTKIDASSKNNESFWIGIDETPFFGADFNYSENLSFTSQMDKEMGEIFKQSGFETLIDSKGNPHVSWISSLGNMTNIDSDLMYIRWDGKNWVCIDGSMFNLTKNNFKENPANISKNHVTSNHSFKLDSDDNPHFAWIQNLGDFEAVAYIYWDGEKRVNIDGSAYESTTDSEVDSSTIVAKCPRNKEKYFSLPTLTITHSGNPCITWKLHERFKDSVTNSLCFLRWNGHQWSTILDYPVDTGDYDNSQFYSPGGTIYDYKFVLNEYSYPAFLVDNGKLDIEYLIHTTSGWKTINDKELKNDEDEKIKIFTHLKDSNISKYSIHLDENATPHIFYQKNILGNGYEDDRAELHYEKWTAELQESESLMSGISEGGVEILHSKIQIDSSGFPQIAFCLSKKYPRDSKVFYIKFDGLGWVNIDEEKISNELSLDNPASITDKNSDKRLLFDDFVLDENDNPYLITEMIYSYPESEIPEDGWQENPIFFIKGNEGLIKETRCKTKAIELWINKREFQVDGEKMEFDVPPQIIDDSTYVPLRALGDVLGCNTEWVADERKVIYTYNDKCNGEITTLEIWIGKQIGKKSGETWDMGLAPLIVNDRTVVPLRAISEGLGADVSWEAETRKIIITQN